MPRTTLNLDDDVMRVAQGHAKRHRLTLGEAVGQLVRRGADRPLVTYERNGIQVVRLPPDSPKVTSAQVKKALEEFP